MPTDPVSRREFAKGIAAGCLIGSSPAAEGVPTMLDSVNAQESASRMQKSPVELSLEILHQQYPHPLLTEAALAEIRDDIAHHLTRSSILSAYPLSNADEPGFVFAAYRKD